MSELIIPEKEFNHIIQEIIKEQSQLILSNVALRLILKSTEDLNSRANALLDFIENTSMGIYEGSMIDENLEIKQYAISQYSKGNLVDQIYYSISKELLKDNINLPILKNEEIDKFNVVEDIIPSVINNPNGFNQVHKSNNYINEVTITKAQAEPDICILKYNDKAHIILGNTKPIKDKIKEKGARFNKYLTHPQTGDKVAAWIIPSTRLTEFELLLEIHNNKSFQSNISLNPMEVKNISNYNFNFFDKSSKSSCDFVQFLISNGCNDIRVDSNSVNILHFKYLDKEFCVLDNSVEFKIDTPDRPIGEIYFTDINNKFKSIETLGKEVIEFIDTWLIKEKAKNYSNESFIYKNTIKSITVLDSRPFINFKEANDHLRWAIDQQIWSNATYTVEFIDGLKLNGIIDLEPKDFWNNNKEPFSWHLQYFHTNISKLETHPVLSKDKIEFSKNLVSKYCLNDSENEFYKNIEPPTDNMKPGEWVFFKDSFYKNSNRAKCVFKFDNINLACEAYNSIKPHGVVTPLNENKLSFGFICNSFFIKNADQIINDCIKNSKENIISERKQGNQNNYSDILTIGNAVYQEKQIFFNINKETVNNITKDQFKSLFFKDTVVNAGSDLEQNVKLFSVGISNMAKPLEEVVLLGISPSGVFDKSQHINCVLNFNSLEMLMANNENVYLKITENPNKNTNNEFLVYVNKDKHNLSSDIVVGWGNTNKIDLKNSIIPDNSHNLDFENLNSKSHGL